MSFMRDRLTTLRAGLTNLTATEAAGVNTTLVPPGLYTYDVLVPNAPAGTPTGVVTWQEAADGSTWAAINPQVTHTMNGSATAPAHYTGTIRVTKNPSSAAITANLTVILTVGSGSGIVWGKVSVSLARLGGTSGWDGQP
jgi:hypothetical protein